MKKVLLAMLWLMPLSSWALDIPLDGSGGGASKGTSIGYVDMEKIFQLYPQTLSAKEDYAKELRARRERLAKKEQDLEELKNRIAILEQTIKSGAAAPSDVVSSNTAAVPAVPQNLNDLKKELQDKKAEYEDDTKQAQEELLSFEKKQSQMIFGKLYQALRDLAEEEQVTIVVDKTNILYGNADIDLTDKLQNKVRGY